MFKHPSNMAYRDSQAINGTYFSGDLAAIPAIDQHHQSMHRRRTSTSATVQAAVHSAHMAQDFLTDRHDCGNSSGTVRPHPTLSLSHVQHIVPSHNTQSVKASVEKSKYHQAISRSTEDVFNAQLAKSFAMPLTQVARARDEAQPRRISLALAATHPANYDRTAANNPDKRRYSVVSTSMQPGKQASPLSSQNFSSSSSKSSQSPATPPWRVYTDPMWQTSSDPHNWGIDPSILKHDTNIEHSGNTTSPTFMIPLPFGGMVEMANVYPVVDDDIA